jgi:hypothetical protein
MQFAQHPAPERFADGLILEVCARHDQRSSVAAVTLVGLGALKRRPKIFASVGRGVPLRHVVRPMERSAPEPQSHDCSPASLVDILAIRLAKAERCSEQNCRS